MNDAKKAMSAPVAKDDVVRKSDLESLIKMGLHLSKPNPLIIEDEGVIKVGLVVARSHLYPYRGCKRKEVWMKST